MRNVVSRVESVWQRFVVEPLRDVTGQTLAEYSILVTVVAVGLTLLALLVFREALTGAFDSVTECLDGSC